MFHEKRFPVALAVSFFGSGGIQCFFLQFTVNFSLLISVSVYLAFFLTGSIPFISAYALCPVTLCDLGKSETETYPHIA